MADVIYDTEMHPTTKIRALTLLELAHPDNGHVTLEWGELTELWNCSKGTVRRQLGAIHEAGLIHYSSNGDGVVYVTFKHLSRAHARNSAKISRESARPRAENALPEATQPAAADDAARAHARNSAKISRESARPRAENALPEANYSHGRADAGLVGWLDGSTIQTDPSPTNQPVEPQPPTPAPAAPVAEPVEAVEALTDEQTTAFALLSEIRMRPDKAALIARTVPLQLIRDAVGAWWTNRKAAGGKLHDQPGVVVAHLLNGRTLLPLPPDSWPQDPLYQRHRTRAERDVDAAAARSAAEVEIEPAQPLAPLRPKPEPGTPEAFWRQLQSDFALHQPDSLDSDLQGSWVIAYADGVFTIGIADAFRLDWVERKLRNQVKRRLAVIMGLPDVDVHFQAPQDGAP